MPLPSAEKIPLLRGAVLAAGHMQKGDIRPGKLTTQIQKFYSDRQKNRRVQRYQHMAAFPNALTAGFLLISEKKRGWNQSPYPS